MRLKRFHFLAALISISLLFLVGAIFSIAQGVPNPEDFLGFRVGDDYRLATYEQALEYFRALEKASSRIRLFDIGKTSMGKSMIYAVISSSENMKKLDRFKDISRRLSLVKGVKDEEARQMAAEGKVVVYIDGGLHATECAPAQHNIQLAYDLLASEDAGSKLIRDNCILVLVFANPDGMDLLAEWYHPNVGTPYEVSSMPWLYHKYVGHDNNRDSYMVTQLETRHLTRIVNQVWYPQVLYNHHQTGPFPTRIWVPPHSEPTNPNIHPLVIRWQNLIGSAMAAAFDREGKKGVVSGFRYDTWYPGYVTQVVDSHNIISLLTETNLYRYATPHFYTLSDFPEEYQDFTISAFYPNPWTGGWWRLRDAVEYCLTSSKAVLHTAAKYSEELLYDKYRMGKDVIARFQKEPPYAWIIPQEQWDPPTTTLMLNNLILLGIDVYQAGEAFVSDGISYPERTWIIPLDQPFALFVKNLFEEQAYPDLTKYPHLWQSLVRPQKFPEAYLPPYDMAGWTLPYQMGVKVYKAYTPVEVSKTLLEKVTPSDGKLRSAGYAYLIHPKTNNSFTAINRILKNGGKVLRARASFSTGGKSYPPGTFIVLVKSVSRSFMESLSKELFLTIDGIGKSVPGETYTLSSPRIALYKSWVASMDEGWTRWLLEQYEFPFVNIHDAEIRAGNLKDRFDVIVFPSMTTDTIISGHRLGTVPLQYVGGITSDGVAKIKKFIDEGGILVTLNSSAHFALDKLNLSVQDVLKGVRPPGRRETPRGTGPPKFACPGSLLRVEFDNKHPIAYGMPGEAAVVFTRSPAFRILPSFKNAPIVVAKYPGENLLMSGYLRGEKYLQNQGSVVEALLGKGKVILLGFGVQSRAQPHGTFKLLFNSLYYSTSK